MPLFVQCPPRKPPPKFAISTSCGKSIVTTPAPRQPPSPWVRQQLQRRPRPHRPPANRPRLRRLIPTPSWNWWRRAAAPLAPPDGKPGKPGAAGTVTGDAKLVHDEALDSSKQQAGDLKDRLSEAEEIINILQRQVNIKDQELAALQARLAELGVKQGDLGKPVDATATGAAPVEAGKPAAEAPAATEVRA